MLIIFNLDNYSIRVCKRFSVISLEDLGNVLNVIVSIPFERDLYNDLRFNGDTYSVFGKYDSISSIRSVTKNGDSILISGIIKKHKKGEFQNEQL